MNRCLIISLLFAVLCGPVASAFRSSQDSLQVKATADSSDFIGLPFGVRPTIVDSLAVGDTMAIADSVSDADLMQLLMTPQTDTVKKEFDRGFDVSSMVKPKRMRSVDVTPLDTTPFLKNTFASLRLTSLTMINDDYSSGLQAGLSFGKWITPDHAVRANIEMGQWYDNFDYEPIWGTEISASYLFNISSYAFGYRTNRFFEAMAVAGLGFANSTLTKFNQGQSGDKSGSALTAHVGFNLNLRLFKHLDFFLEPQAVIYTNGMAVSNAGNWRSRLPAFRGTFGFTYNILQSYLDDSPALLPRKDGYFISLMMGPSYQHSEMVYKTVGLGRGLGVQVALGIGKYYTDYFAIRYSGSYSRDTWAYYKTYDESFPANYFALRAEGMFDVYKFIRHCVDENKPEKPYKLSASLLFVPEIGYMYKVDKHDAEYIHIYWGEVSHVLKSLYMGMSIGAQVKYNLASRLSIFVEPRFSIVPYDAASLDENYLNDRRNYWDSVVNLNLGVEFML